MVNSYAMSSVAIAVFVDIILWNSLAPERTTLKFDVLDIDTSIDDVYVNTLAAGWVVFVLREGAKTKPGTMADSCKTLDDYS